MKRKTPRPLPTRAVTHEPGAVLRALKRLGWCVVVALVLTGIGLVSYDMGHWWLTSETFAIATLTVDAPTPGRRATIENELQFVLGHNIWRLSSRRVLEQVESYPWVEAARVDKRYPAGLQVTVRARVPVAFAYDSQGEAIAVDDKGWFFELEGPGGRTYDGLPQIVQVDPELIYPGARVHNATTAAALAAAAQLRSENPALWNELDSVRIGPYQDVYLCTCGPLGEVVLPPLERKPLSPPALAAVRETLLSRELACSRTDFRSTRSLVVLRPADLETSAQQPGDVECGKTYNTTRQRDGSPRSRSFDERTARAGTGSSTGPVARADDGVHQLPAEGGE